MNKSRESHEKKTADPRAAYRRDARKLAAQRRAREGDSSEDCDVESSFDDESEADTDTASQPSIPDFPDSVCLIRAWELQQRVLYIYGCVCMCDADIHLLCRVSVGREEEKVCDGA